MQKAAAAWPEGRALYFVCNVGPINIKESN